MKNSFVFYASFYEAISLLPNENQLKVYHAISKFALTGQEPTDLADVEKAVFILIKPQIIANNERYQNGCKGAEFGLLGGRPKKKTETPKKPQPNPIGVIEKNPNQTPNENENVNVNENVNENDIKEKEIEKEKEKPHKTKQQKQPQAQLPPALPSDRKIKPQIPQTPQASVYEYFAAKYQKLTGIKYLSKKEDFIILAKLTKDYGQELVKQKIDWLETGCLHPGVFWFAEDKSNFTIGTLKTQWNAIIPKLTTAQRKEEEKRRKDQELKAKVLAGLAEEEKLKRGGVNGSRIQ